MDNKIIFKEYFLNFMSQFLITWEGENKYIKEKLCLTLVSMISGSREKDTF